MFSIFNPYNKKARTKQGKFINFDDHFYEWFRLSFKKYYSKLDIFRSIAIILLLIFLTQIGSVIKFSPAGAEGDFSKTNIILDHVIISPSSSSVQVDGTQSYTVDAYDQSNNLITSGLAYDWSATTGGAMNNNTIQSPTYTAGQKAGGFNISVTVMQGAISKQDGTVVHITAGPLDHFLFNTIASQTAGNPFSMTITACDQYNNIDTGFAGTCGLTDLTSTINPSSTSNFVAGQWTGNVIITQAMSADTITAIKTGDAEKGISNAFDINHAKAASLNINPHLTLITTGSKIAYTSVASDPYGNTWDVTTDTKFSIDKGAGGSWAGNTYKSEKAGVWKVTGIYIADPAVADTALLMVESALPLQIQSAQTGSGQMATAEIGTASSIGPQPQVLAESIIKPLPGFAETTFPLHSSSAVGIPTSLIVSESRNIGSLLVILGILLILTSFLGWFVLSAPQKPVQKELWDKK